ncbi:hypothetical protein RCL1_005333 [Eukaryota sp. TZLM3-RCL]
MLLFVYVAATVLVSFLCSFLESSLYSVPYGHLEELLATSPKKKAIANKVLNMKNNVDRPLTAILTMNTLVNIIGSAGVGREIAFHFGPQYTILGGFLFTIIILIFCEIIPKIIGSTYSKSLMGITFYLCKCLIFLTFLPLGVLGEGVSWLISGNAGISRAEATSLAFTGKKSKAITDQQFTIIRNLLKLNRTPIRTISTPRTVISAFDHNTTVRDALKTNVFVRFTRVPVFRNFPDDCVGYVHRSKVLRALKDGRLDLKLSDASLLTRMRFVDENVSVAAAISNCIKYKEHMLLVIDKFAGTEGVVTLEDCLECLLGAELTDETDVAVDLRVVARSVCKSAESERRQSIPSLIDSIRPLIFQPPMAVETVNQIYSDSENFVENISNDVPYPSDVEV